MDNRITIIGILVFCLAMLGFLFVFKLRSLTKPFGTPKYVYIFAFVGILAILGAQAMGECLLETLCALICGVSFGHSLYFLLEEKNNKVFVSVLSVVFGLGSFLGVERDFLFPLYILVFAIVASFVLGQFNQIRMDKLTRLYNRYGMDIELKEQLRQYRREHTDSFYIIACDMDKFKHINDTWGHAEGDRALVLVASALEKVAKAFRSKAFRIGGDEFVIITDTSEEGLALCVTEALQKALDAIDFRDDFTINMSIGTALYDGVCTIAELLNSADKKLYEAKKAR